MATGAGKTRTVIALIDVLMRAGWVKRALFLADRIALVNQAVGAFKTHLPDVTTVNLVTERREEGRVYVSTYPTMMGLIGEAAAGDKRRFGPGFFDLVVIDEAHRSVYQKYRAIFAYFDSLLIGLTATPKDEVAHDTYGLFDLEPGVPTDYYDLDEAVDEGFLVPPRAITVPLKFPREGIRYDDLTEEEKERWESQDWGDESEDPPDAVAAEAVNRWLFNADTVDKLLETLMTHGHRVAGGDRLGKTIVFAKNNEHAEFIADRFDANYPEHAGHFARVITYRTEYAQSLDRRFLGGQQGPAHRCLGRHAGHRHRRSGGRQPRVLQAGQIEDQVLADDRARHPPLPRSVRPWRGQAGLPHLRLLRQHRVLQPAHRAGHRRRRRVAADATIQRAADADPRTGGSRRRGRRNRQRGGSPG